MNQIVVALALVVVVFWGTSLASANDITLDGTFQQGGLVMGQTIPGSRLIFEGREVRINPEGRFIIAFGREAPSVAQIKISMPDGSEQIREIEIAPRDYKIQRIDGLPASKVSPPEDVYVRIKAENKEIARARQIDSPQSGFLETGFQWPAIGVVTGVYGSQRILNGIPKQPHYGIDIAAPEGTAVVAPAGGTVTLAEDDLYYTGGTIIIDHGHGLSSAFLHLHEVAVAVGDQLEKGQEIGTVGSTGRSTGPHLDWRINWFNVRVDPAFLVGPMPAQ
ncbi:MAG: M23 family metallopeptidase [Pseudomonadota bacterium]